MVLWCRDVKFDDALDGLLTGLCANAQVGRLAARGPDSACLDAKFVEPAMFWPGLSKPVG